MFAAIKAMIVAICTAVTDTVQFLGGAMTKSSKGLDALAEYGCQEAELIRDRGKVKNAAELSELAKALKNV